jgi:hypothetical protein
LTVNEALPAVLARKIYASFDGSPYSGSLTPLCRSLVENQMETWPEFRQGNETLKQVKARDILCAGFSVRVQHNPGRIKSTMAGVEKKDVSARPCFLCLADLPAEQKGILYRGAYLILCNPMPVFASHLTVSHVDHRPQAIAGNVLTFLSLAADLGKPWTVLYNGPRCGASAPDHLHFQVIPSGLMPIEKEIAEKGNSEPVREVDGVILSRAIHAGREVALLRGGDPSAVGRAFMAFVQALRRALHEDDEPMMSMVGLHDGEEFLLMVFPRAKHRPRAFFREGDARLVVSPAVIEMGGVMITPMERDFYRLNRQDVEDIYEEVSMDGKTVEAAVRSLILI